VGLQTSTLSSGLRRHTLKPLRLCVALECRHSAAGVRWWLLCVGHGSALLSIGLEFLPVSGQIRGRHGSGTATQFRCVPYAASPRLYILLWARLCGRARAVVQMLGASTSCLILPCTCVWPDEWVDRVGCVGSMGNWQVCTKLLGTRCWNRRGVRC